jgi:hypothetical protein
MALKMCATFDGIKAARCISVKKARSACTADGGLFGGERKRGGDPNKSRTHRGVAGAVG